MSPKYPFSLLFLSVWMISSPFATVGQLAKAGCNDTCGNVHIPYPFGIGSGCALNESYTIICNSSKPYLSKLNLEVLNVSLPNRTVTIKTPITHFCQAGNQTDTAVTSWNGSNLAGTPFFYSKTHNKLMLFGCGNAVLNQNKYKILSSCTATCEFNTPHLTTSCYGVNCCETAIPFYLTKYHLNLTISGFKARNCSSAFLADQNWLPEKFSESLQSVPVVLAWTLQRADIHAVHACPYRITNLELESGRNFKTFICPTCELGSTYPRQPNPYLQQQCGRGVMPPDPITRNKKSVLVGAFTNLSVLFLIAFAFTFYKQVKIRRIRRMRKKFFKRNGGLLLQQQLSADENVMERTRIFTAKELDQASDQFNENRVLGRGGQGTVYKGMLFDGKIVAIKKSKRVDESQLEQFINEVVILSQVNHRNVVKLLGCCLETEVPLLVYEFIPNGTLSSLIHNQTEDEFPFTWNLRLRIAGEVAGALAYLHSATSNPIYHRDIKSSNILLDGKYIAKVSDFGTSRSIAIDKTHLTTQVKGTFGYLDPEYFQSNQFTEKSDVYSFGVVLVELLTRKKPISSAGSEEDSHLSLATRFLMNMDENCLNSFLDPQLLDQRIEEEVVGVAKLAQRCLNLKGKKRPTMKEVAIELENIKLSANRSTTQASSESQGVMTEESVSVVLSDVNPSWTSGR